MTATEAFVVEMRVALMRNAESTEIHALLCRHRDAGLAQRTAYDSLLGMREGASDQLDDQLLDWMDIVWGWCSPAHRIWDTVLEG